MNEELEIGQAIAEGACEAADVQEDGWSDSAYAAVYAHALTHREFIIAEVSERMGCPNRTDRAWGAVAKKLNRDKVIERSGVVNSSRKGCHGTFVTLWKSNVYTG